MIKLIYLSPTLHDGIPKNPGDSRVFDEFNIDSLMELKGLLSPDNPLSNKVCISPEHQHVYQSALSLYRLDELPLTTNHTSPDLLKPVVVDQTNPFIEETQVVVKRLQEKLSEESKDNTKVTESPALPEENKEPESLSLPPTQEVPVEESKEEESEYSLIDEINLRRNELDNTHHSKIRSLAETYGITYTNKESAIKSILRKEFQESAESLNQTELLDKETT